VFNVSWQNLGTWKPVEKTGECGQRSTNENIVGGEIAQVSIFISLIGLKS
jgi:hypothetical protein